MNVIFFPLTTYSGSKIIGVGNSSTLSIKSHGFGNIKTSSNNSLSHLPDLLHIYCMSSTLVLIRNL